jgi:NADPH2:quinone reductase
LVKEQGATHVLDHHDPTHVDQVLGLTGGRGVDVILEMLANENLGKDLKLLAPFGRIVVIGCRGTVEIDPREAMVRDASILGTRLRNVSPEVFRTIHAELADGFVRGRLRPIVGNELPLAQAAEAHHAVMRPPAYGNIVLITEPADRASAHIGRLT